MLINLTLIWKPQFVFSPTQVRLRLRNVHISGIPAPRFSLCNLILLSPEPSVKKKINKSQHHSLNVSLNLKILSSHLIPLSLVIQILYKDKPEDVFQFSSVAQSCPTLWDPMDCSMPGLPVHHQLPESTQTHVHWVSDTIQPSHRVPPSSSPALHLSHLGVFQLVGSLHQVAKVLELQIQHHFFQWKFRTGFL